MTMNAQLRAAWCHVLGLEDSDISNDCNFFTEGGDSVMAMRLVTAARERNIALDTEIIFNHPVFMDMANLCRPTKPDKDSGVGPRSELDESVVQACVKACGVQRNLIEDVFPATFFQLLVFHDHMARGAMLLQTVFEIRGSLDLDVLRQTWQLLHDKNHIMRTRLVKHDDQILQVVVNDSIQWESGNDLAEYKASDISKRVGSGDSLFRYAIVSEGDRTFVVWTCHHGGFDGWSRRLIMDKLEEGLLDLERLKSEPQGPAFRSFVEWQDSRAHRKNKAEAFWKQYLPAGYTDLEGVHRPSPDYKPHGRSQVSRQIKMTKTADTDLAITLPTIGHAAWALAVGCLWNIEDVLFVTVKMGRQMARDSPLPEAESIMGPMMAICPVRVGIRKEMTAGAFLQQMQDQFITTIQYEHEAWSTFQDMLGMRVILPGMVNWHPLGSDVFSRTLKYKALNGEVGYLKPVRDLSTHFSVNVSMLVDIYEHEHYLSLRVSYDENIWEEKRVIKLVDAFSNIFAQILFSRDCQVAELLQGGAESVTKSKARL